MIRGDLRLHNVLCMCVGLCAMRGGLGLFGYHSVSKKIKSFLGTCVEFFFCLSLSLSPSLSSRIHRARGTVSEVRERD